MSFDKVRAIARELRASARNYENAAIIRRHVRAKYGVVVTVRPSILIGEALVALTRAPWGRFTVLAALLVIAKRM